jgi:uncharacterized protein involved in outer membrane biogenesis
MATADYYRKILRYFLLSLGAALLLLLAATGLVYYIAVSDQERVPEWVEAFSREQFGVEASFEHYRFQYFEHFPFLSLSLKGITLKSPELPKRERELLRIKSLDIVFRPWKLLRQEFELREITVDTARLQMHRDSLGQDNWSFLPLGYGQSSADSSYWSALTDMRGIRVNGFFFDYRDDLLRKHHQLVVQHSNLQFLQGDSLRQLNISGQWRFHKLLFKRKNGPYFRQQDARVGLKIALSKRQPRIDLLPSTVALSEDTLHLSGFLRLPAPGYLKLRIHSDGLLLEDAKPWLADNLQRALAPYSIDRPLKVDMKLEGPTIPGQKQPIWLDVKADSVNLRTNTLRFTGARLRAHYRNDCDSSGIIPPHTDCLEMELTAAQLFDTIPINLRYFHQDLKSQTADIAGDAQVALPKLNAYLPNEQLQFSGGQLALEFEMQGNPADLIDAQVKQLRPTIRARGRLTNARFRYLPNRLQFSAGQLSFKLSNRSLQLTRAQFDLNGASYQLSGHLYGLPALLFDKANQVYAQLELETNRLSAEDFLGQKSPSSAYSPDQWTGRALQRISQQIRADLLIKADLLTYRNLRLAEVYLSARMRARCADYNSPCLLVDSLSGLAFGRIPLRGKLHVWQPANPQVDLQLATSLPLAEVQPLLPDKLLRLHSGEFGLQLRYQGLFRDYASLDKAALEAELDGDIHLRQASGDYLPKGYRFRAIDAQLRFDERDLLIDTLSGQLNGNYARASGKIHGMIPLLFAPDQEQLQASLKLQSPAIDLNAFNLQPLQDGNAASAAQNPISRSLQKTLERLSGQLELQTDTLLYRDMRLTAVDLKSRLLPACSERAEQNGCIEVDTITALLFGNTPLRASLRIEQPEDPILTADAEVEMPLRELDRMFPPDQFLFEGGKLRLSFRYQGQPHRHFDVENALLKAKLEGEGALQNAAFTYKPRGYRFQDTDVKYAFDGEDLHFDTIALLLNGNRMRGRGVIREFLPFLFLPEQQLDASFRVAAAKFDLNNFKAPQNFQDSISAGAEEPTVITRLVNAGLSNIKADFDLQFDTVAYRNFLGREVSGQIALGGGALEFERTKMQLADGHFSLSGDIQGLRNNQPDLNLRAKLANTDVRKVFHAFDNFGQSALTKENVEGRLSADIAFRSRANANYELDPASMRGRFEFRLENGSLIELPALDSINNLLFRKRDLSNIKFATLENTLYLNGQDLKIGHFHIPSSVLTFSVQGTYCLGGDGHTNLLFELPLANLFRSDLGRTALENMEESRGPNILIRAEPAEEGEGLRFRWVLSRQEK